MRLILLMLCLWQFVGAVDVAKLPDGAALLEHAEVYVDPTQSLTFAQIREREFVPCQEDPLMFGYSPRLTLWIRLELENSSDRPIERVLEYANPLTSFVSFYTTAQQTPVQTEGLLGNREQRTYLNPTYTLRLQPGQKQLLYIEARAKVTTLIATLKLWKHSTFIHQETHRQVYLALFFGAIGIIILYNLMLFLLIRDSSYLYYVLFFISILIHQFFYRGMATLYLPASFPMISAIQYASLIVAAPALFLALFMRQILQLKQYPVIEKILRGYLLLFVPGTLLLYLLGLDQYRLLSALLFGLLLLILLYALIRRNPHAYYLAIGWLLFLVSGILMYLSSKGYYDIFGRYPYYTEVSLVLESLIFSFVLAHRIKRLHREKAIAQHQLLRYEEHEKYRLQKIVKEQTADLQQALASKSLLLRELNHRVKNSMQTILSFLQMEQRDIQDTTMQERLTSLQNRVYAINHLYTLLHTEENLETVAMQSYLSLLLDTIKQSRSDTPITLSLHVETDCDPDNALQIGLIINEALTNSYKYAFVETEQREVTISLTREQRDYRLVISDNGQGYTVQRSSDTLGHKIIRTLVEVQLEGRLQIENDTGVTLIITWEENHV